MSFLNSVVISAQQVRQAVERYMTAYAGKYQSLKTSLSAATIDSKKINLAALRKFAFFIISGVLAVFFLFYILLYTGITSPIHITSWILDSSNHATTKEGLLASINFNETLKESIKNGSLYQLTPFEASQPWRKPFSFNDPFSTNKAPLVADSRCPIYTYFPFNVEMVQKDFANNTQKLNDALTEIQLESKILDTWAHAMWAIGLQPVILNHDHAKLHPRYDSFEASNVLSPEKRKENRKWLAWLAAGAGIYSDYRVIPVATNANDEAIQFLKSCNFKERLAFDDRSLSLIVSNIKDTKPFLFDIMRGFSEKELLSDFEVYNQDAFAYYSNRNFRTITNTLTGGINSARVAENDNPVNPKRILDLMRSHLYKRFSQAYPDGFRISDSENIKYLGSLIWGQTIAVFDTKYCYPTPTVLHNLAYANDRHHMKISEACTSSKHLSSPSSYHSSFDLFSQLPPPLYGPRVLTLASIEHPYTLLALHNQDVTVDAVRESPRDYRIRQLTNAVVGSAAVGTDLRLLAFKDSVYQSTALSNISWLYMEQNARDAVTAVEWDIGIVFDFRDAELLYERLEKNYISFTTPENYQQIIERIQNDLNIDYLDRKQSNQTHVEDPVFEAIKLWHAADYEAWRFLKRWAGEKKASRQAVINQLELYKVPTK